MLTFNKKYFAFAILLFITEVLIALYLDDIIIRPYGGDFLVVILIYCFIKAFLNLPVKTVAIFVLIFSFTIEFLQYLKFVKILGLEKSRLACVVLGTSFAWSDLLAYTLGILFVIWMENVSRKKQKANVHF